MTSATLDVMLAPMSRKINSSPYTSPQGKKQLCSILSELYPDPRSELHFSNEYELLVAVVLSAQCTDKKVNQVTPLLFSRYPTPDRLAVAEVPTVEAIIRPINYYKTKARNLIRLAQVLTDQHNGAVPRSHEALVELPGVGNKTANVVLGELQVKPTFPVDTHVFRLANRLGLSRGKNVEQVEDDLCRIFPPTLWRSLHHWLILHGRRVCKAPNPRCEECPLSKRCPSATQKTPC